MWGILSCSRGLLRWRIPTASRLVKNSKTIYQIYNSFWKFFEVHRRPYRHWKQLLCFLQKAPKILSASNENRISNLVIWNKTVWSEAVASASMPAQTPRSRFSEIYNQICCAPGFCRSPVAIAPLGPMCPSRPPHRGRLLFVLGRSRQIVVFRQLIEEGIFNLSNPEFNEILVFVLLSCESQRI